MDEPMILNRALAAYYRAGNHPTNQSPQADMALYRKKRYVVVRATGSVRRGLPLAVYRIKNDGALKRLKRWPEGL